MVDRAALVVAEAEAEGVCDPAEGEVSVAPRVIEVDKRAGRGINVNAPSLHGERLSRAIWYWTYR